MVIKNGFEFLITKNNYIGRVTSIDINNKITTCAFFDNEGFLFGVYSVYVDTIRNNLKAGAYKELK